MTAEAAPTNATEAVAERLFAATIDTLELASVHIGGAARLLSRARRRR